MHPPPPAFGLLLNHSLLKQQFVLLWGDISMPWYSHWKTTRHAFTARIVVLITYPHHPYHQLYFCLVTHSHSRSHPWESRTNKTPPAWDPPHAGMSRPRNPTPLLAVALESCWHDGESGRASREASIIIGPQCPELPSGGCPTYFWTCTVSRGAPTLWRGEEVSQCTVLLLWAANAVKIFRAEAVRDKELIDWRFSGDLSYEIREKLPQLGLLPLGFSFTVNWYCKVKGQVLRRLHNVIIYKHLVLAQHTKWELSTKFHLCRFQMIDRSVISPGT